MSFGQCCSPTPAHLFITCCFTVGRSFSAPAMWRCVYSRRLGRLHACRFLPVVARRTGGGRAVLPSLHSLRVLAVGGLLLDGRAHVLAPVVLGACHGLGFACLAPTRTRHHSMRCMGGSLGGWISDPLLFPLSLGSYRDLPRSAPWSAREKTPYDMHFRDGVGDRALVFEGAGVSRSLAGHSGLVDDRAVCASTAWKPRAISSSSFFLGIPGSTSFGDIDIGPKRQPWLSSDWSERRWFGGFVCVSLAAAVSCFGFGSSLLSLHHL